MNPDHGSTFGSWDDETSRLIYHDAMPALLVATDTSGLVLDLGGGNGLAREFFPRVVTVDSNPTMGSDIVADAITYVPKRRYDRVLVRYVLHYLDDAQARELFANVARWHGGPLTVIQFVNDDLEAKLANSVNETKHFRTEDQLVALFGPWKPVHRVAVEYDVTPDFYRNRLGHPNPTGHREKVVAYECEVPR